MITLRIDVDYAFPSRFKSCLAMKRLTWTDDVQYLSNAKSLAGIINSAKQEVKAYWFFTKYTLPDKEMLSLLSSDCHVIGLHVVNNPSKELKLLELVVGKPVEYYTIHGTERLIGQIIWNRKLGQKQAVVPESFPLKSFHSYLTYCLDWLCHEHSYENAMIAVKDWIGQNAVLEMHPEWLFKSGGSRNPRGAYATVLKNILA